VQGQIVVGGNEQHIRVAQEFFDLERALERRQHREGEVELAALDEAEEVVIGCRLRQLELDERPPLEEAAHHLREDLGADALERPDSQMTALALRERGHVRLGGVEAGDDRLRVPEQQRPRLRERDRPRPTGALEQPLPDEPLERLDLLRDRRLGVPERCRCASERPFTCDRLESGEMTKLDPEPSIRFHDRIEE
jgi:hypothetical protein